MVFRFARCFYEITSFPRCSGVFLSCRRLRSWHSMNLNYLSSPPTRDSIRASHSACDTHLEYNSYKTTISHWIRLWFACIPLLAPKSLSPRSQPAQCNTAHPTQSVFTAVLPPVTLNPELQ